jgi:hypothetical protein
MKRTRLFFAVTTFCLAIAAVASTKANGKLTQIGYTADSFGNCTVSSGISCGIEGNGCVKSGNVQLFEQSSGACSVALAKP